MHLTVVGQLTRIVAKFVVVFQRTKKVMKGADSACRARHESYDTTENESAVSGKYRVIGRTEVDRTVVSGRRLQRAGEKVKVRDSSIPEAYTQEC